jgi:hypothetical protein
MELVIFSGIGYSSINATEKKLKIKSDRDMKLDPQKREREKAGV